MKNLVGKRVMVVEGSSDGHTGVVLETNQRPSGVGVTIKRDYDGVKVSVPFGSYCVLNDITE